MHLHQSLSLAILVVITTFSAQPASAVKTNYRSPEPVPGARTITAEEAKSLFDEGTVFIDVRNPRLHARRHIPGTYHLDLKNAYNEDTLGAIADKEESIVIYCSGVKCSRSSRASKLAVSWGYTAVYYFRGGIVDWRNAGYPLKSSGEQSSAEDDKL